MVASIEEYEDRMVDCARSSSTSNSSGGSIHSGANALKFASLKDHGSRTSKLAWPQWSISEAKDPARPASTLTVMDYSGVGEWDSKPK